MTIIKMKNIFFLLFFFTIICNVDASTNDSLECINNAHEEIGGLDENKNNDEKNILEESEEFDKNIIFNLNENKKQKYGVYFGFKTGLTITHSYNVSITSANSTENLPYKFSNVLNFDGFIGYSFFEKFHIPVRTEVEFSYNDKSVYDTLNWIKANTFSLNHYYDAYALSFDEDFNNYNVSFVPYVLLGLGITDAELSVINPIEKKMQKSFSSFSFNSGIGVRARIGEYFHLNFGYKYTKPLKIDFKNNNLRYSGNLDIHSITTGLSVNF